MKSHWLVIAAIGWYMLMPPDKCLFDTKCVQHTPLNEWTQVWAFDSAAKCEADNTSMSDFDHALLKRTSQSAPNADARYAQVWIDDRTLCVQTPGRPGQP